MRPIAHAFAAMLALLLSGCATEPRLPCALTDKDCAYEAMRVHPAKALSFWTNELAKPLAERLGSAPPELVELLALDNIYNGYPNRPRRSAPAGDFVTDVREAIAELPESVRRAVAGKLAGVYFVEDIGGTAFTEMIYADSNPVAGFVILDPSVLQKSANEWATWKESTPFRAHQDFRLAARIEEGPRDIRKYAIQYIVLHELGHVLEIGGNVNPNWNLRIQDIGSTVEFAYYGLSWSAPGAGNRHVTRFDDAFPQRGNVVYYFGAKLGGDEMLATYDALERTNFPTLYAATNPHDDFAEAFASYVHTILMNRPFSIELFANGRLAKSFGACWALERCAQKRRFLEALLTPGLRPVPDSMKKEPAAQ